MNKTALSAAMKPTVGRPLPGAFQYIQDIDGLRAIAVVLVLLFHAFPQWVPGGFIGVDVFFVISGFVIARAYMDGLISGRMSALKFFEARFRRLLPALVVVLLATTIVAFIILYPDDLLRFGRSLLAQPFYVQNFVFWLEGDYFEKALQKPLLHTWSLAVEEQFYLLFALTAVLLKGRRGMFLWLLLAGCALSLAVGQILAQISPKTPFYLLPGRIWQLGLGIFASIVAARIGSRSGRWIPFIAVFSLGAVLASGLLFDETARFPGLQALLASGGCAVALVCFAVRPEGRIFRFAFPLYVGRISYPLYLWHWPPLSLLAIYAGSSTPPPPPAVAAACLVLTFVLAALTARYVERPFRSRRLLPGRRSILTASAASLAGVAGIGAGLVSTSGAIFRYPVAIQPFFEAAQQRSSQRCRVTFRIFNPTAESCRLSAGNGAGVLVLGDSHAEMLKEAIGGVAAERNIPAFLTVRNCDIGSYGTSSYCSHAIREKILEEARRNDVGRIVAISRWIGTPDTFPMLEEDAGMFLDQGLDMTIVFQTPYDETYAPAQRAKDALDGGELQTDGLLLRDWRAMTADFEQRVAALAAANGGRVRVVDPATYICEAEARCVYATNGYPLYHDADHLNEAGARFLEPMIVDILSAHEGSDDERLQ